MEKYYSQKKIFFKIERSAQKRDASGLRALRPSGRFSRMPLAFARSACLLMLCLLPLLTCTVDLGANKPKTSEVVAVSWLVPVAVS